MRKSAIALLCAALLAATVAAATAETIQQHGIKVSFNGRITPSKLPRSGTAPVAVAVSTRIHGAAGKPQPQLTKIEIAINRHGHIDPTGLPVCEVSDVQPATNAKALEACRGALVGEGRFSASVALNRQAAFPSDGKLLAFNGTYRGKPAILAHVYGTEPVPTSFTLPFVVGRTKGTFGSTLTATLPPAEDNLVTAIDLQLHRTFTYRGKRRSFASAGCPAPKGLSLAPFPFARASYVFVGGKKLSSTLTRTCHARG
jgi:hypothetical protein